MIHSQGERSNETAPQHTSITGRSRRCMLREKTGERQKTYTRKAGQLDQPMRAHHRSPLLPHSCMGGDTFLCNRQHWKTHTTTRILTRLDEVKHCIPVDAVLVGRLGPSATVASLGLLRATGPGATKMGGGGGIRSLSKEYLLTLNCSREEQKQNSIS